MLNVDSRLGEHGLVRLLLVKMGEDVTILEGGECLSVAPDTNSTKSAWSNTWLAESNRLNELSTVVMMVFLKGRNCCHCYGRRRHWPLCSLLVSCK